MEYVIRFAISLFDLAVFMYYFHSNKKMKPVSKVWIYGIDRFPPACMGIFHQPKRPIIQKKSER